MVLLSDIFHRSNYGILFYRSCFSVFVAILFFCFPLFAHHEAEHWQIPVSQGEFQVSEYCLSPTSFSYIVTGNRLAGLQSFKNKKITVSTSSHLLSGHSEYFKNIPEKSSGSFEHLLQDIYKSDILMSDLPPPVI